MKKHAKHKAADTEHKNVPVRIPVDLDTQIEKAAEKTGLNKQQVMRLSMERGLSVLVAQLTGQPLEAASASA